MFKEYQRRQRTTTLTSRREEKGRTLSGVLWVDVASLCRDPTL